MNIDELARITGEPRPRCGPSDPGCGPVPVNEERACYRPSAKREVVPERPADEPKGHPGALGVCKHDGECVIAGCGNACVNYTGSGITTDCRGYDYLDEDDVFCGCVEGGCAFFRQ